MPSQSLDDEIQSYLPLLGDDEKQSLLSVINTFINLKNGSTRPTLEDYNKDLDDAKKRVANGEFYTQEEAESWRRNGKVKTE